MRRTLAAALAAFALATSAACGDDESAIDTAGTTEAATPAPAEIVTSDLADVEVTGAAGEEPTLAFDAAFGVEETASRAITEGDGEPIADGAVVTFHFTFVNGRNGQVVESSYDGEPAQLVFEESLMPGIYEGLGGVRAGSRVLIAIAPGDGLGGDPTGDVLETDTLLFFAEVLAVRVPLARAEGTAVPPVNGVPGVVLDGEGAPTITVPTAEPPTELIAQRLIEGAGEVVEAGDTITVHYTGVLWNTGAVFDSSWESGSPATFDIGTGAVIKGWDDGLVGRTVGTQIVLVVPPAQGYPEGSPDGSIAGTDTIVFVIDILDTSG
ncbi:MAG: FKBP-type peptidyl-prolyl cis-trans isomerase [Acidimicrobiales bacterium]